MERVNYISFPPVNQADQDGLLAMGGDLSVDSLVSAYSQGIFPWFNDDQPILWWSPDPRLVLLPKEVKVSRSLTKKIRQQRYKVSSNLAFSDVITHCAYRGINMPQQSNVPLSCDDTWITQSMREAYITLHQQGYAHSIEVWDQTELVGGLYGLALGKVFFGESMFSLANDASKIALVTLCAWLRKHRYQLIDCQVKSDHLISLGAKEVPRKKFLESLKTINIHQTSVNFAQDISQLGPESVINKT